MNELNESYSPNIFLAHSTKGQLSNAQVLILVLNSFCPLVWIKYPSWGHVFMFFSLPDFWLINENENCSLKTNL